MSKRFVLLTLLWAMTSLLGAQSRNGTLELYVFGPDGLGFSGVTFVADGKTWTTNPEGFAEAALSAGPYDLALVKAGVALGTVSVRIRFGEVTEAVVNLRNPGSLTPKAESPSPAPSALLNPPAASPLGSSSQGKLTGQVVHFETRKPVEGATVLVRGSDSEALTDAQGRFSLEVPVGTTALSVIHPQFATQTLNNLVVNLAASAPVIVELTPTALQLESVAVFSASEVLVQGGVSALMEETKNSSVVLNLIGSEQISRTGDSDAAQALGRVTGLTIVDGKNVYVRGMGDRYASSLLNGARLPSPETDKRVVPLDLFPTAILESLAIQKTYGADLYGDFGGGAVSLRTVGVPDDRYKRRLRGSLSFSLGFDPTTLGQPKTLGTGGTLDFLGVDDGTRSLPVPIEPQKFRNNWGSQEVLFLPDPSITFTLRDQYDLAQERRLGWSFATLFKHGLSEDVQNNRSYGNLAGTLITQDMTLITVARGVDAGLLLNAEYEDPSWLKAEATTFGTRLTSQQRVTAQGQDKELPQAILYETSWIEQTLVNQRISAQLKLPGGLENTSQYSLSWAQRSEPDHQYVGYGRESSDEQYTTNERVGRPYRLYTQVEDLIHDATTKFTIPLAFLGWGDHSFEGGGQWIQQNRNTKTRRFTFKIVQDSALPPEQIFLPDSISEQNTSAIRFSESTLSTDQYQAAHSVMAGFATLDLQLFASVRATLGFRTEWSRQSVYTYDLFTGTGSIALLETTDLLPTLNLTVPFGDQWQVRLGGSRTVNRPDLRELSKAPKDGLPGQGQFVGNPKLKRAVIWSGDLRLEQYLGPSESWSVGTFYKQFTDAIELFQEAGAGAIRTPVNVPFATNFGAEFEWNLTLAGLADVLAAFPSPRAATAGEFWVQRQWKGVVGNAFRDLTFTGNLALIWSAIDYQGRPPGVTTSTNRPLQGQSPYVLNLSLTYKNSTSWRTTVKSDTTVTASYNLFGPRIVSLGVNLYPDAYEQPFHQVDVTLKHRIDEAWSLDAKFKNLLDLPSVIQAGSLILEERNKGRSFSLGVKYEF